jgi:hypothetical protein
MAFSRRHFSPCELLFLQFDFFNKLFSHAQLAEKPCCGIVLKGRGFSRAIKVAIGKWALAPEGCSAVVGTTMRNHI